MEGHFKLRWLEFKKYLHVKLLVINLQTIISSSLKQNNPVLNRELHLSATQLTI